MTTTIGSAPRWLDDMNRLIESQVAAKVGRSPEDATHRYGTITSVSPLRVRLDGDANPVAYAPPCLYKPALNDRVLCVVWETQLAILGPVSGGPAYEPAITNTGWVTCSLADATRWNFTGVGTDKAQWFRERDEVSVRGVVRATTLAYDWGIVLVPYSQWYADNPQPVGEAINYTSGGTASLFLNAFGELYIPSALYTSKTWADGDYVHLRARYRTN